MVKKFFLLVLAAALIFPAFISGCAVKVSAQEIANRTAAAIPGVSSVKMNMHATLDMSSTGGSPITLSSTQDMSAEVKASPQEMHALMNISMNMPSLGNTNVSTEMYLTGGWVYSSMNFAGTKTWSKLKLTPEYWQSQNQLQQQAEFLKSATKVTDLGTETVDGVECYVLDVKPDLAALTEYMKTQQAGSSTTFNYGQLDLAKIFKTYNLKEWVAKDTYLIRKAEMSIVMDFSPQDVLATSTSADRMNMTLNANVNFFDYNVPVTITLPPDAAAAKEISSPGLK